MARSYGRRDTFSALHQKIAKRVNVPVASIARLVRAVAREEKASGIERKALAARKLVDADGQPTGIGRSLVETVRRMGW